MSPETRARAATSCRVALTAVRNEVSGAARSRGSTIGNFDPPAAIELMKVMRRIADRSGGLVIGFDLEGIAVSSGSACSSGKVQPSHVLEAMGFGAKLAQGAVRLSLGWSTTEADVESCLKAWRKLAHTLLRW